MSKHVLVNIATGYQWLGFTWIAEVLAASFIRKQPGDFGGNAHRGTR